MSSLTLFRHARVNSNSSVSETEIETVVAPARYGSTPKRTKSRGSEPATPRTPHTPRTPPSARQRLKSGIRRRGWSIQKLTRQFTSKLKTEAGQFTSGTMKVVEAQDKNSFGLSEKGPVKDQLTAMSKDQFSVAISNDTMFQIAQADVSKALKQAGYTVTGLMPNLVNAAVDAAWGQVGKVSSGCEVVKKELEAVKARDVEMKLAHLREISMLRDQIRQVNADDLKAIQSLSRSSMVENVQLYEPLNYLDEDSKTLVMQIVEEKLKELVTGDPDATVVEGKALNHLAFSSFMHGRLEQNNEKYKEDNRNLREEVKALKIELSAQKEQNSSAMATLQEESRATQESLENELAHLKQELKSERSRAEGLSKELEKVKQQHQEALVRQQHYVAACQATSTWEQTTKTSHDKLKTELNQLYSDHVDLKYELQETKRSEEEKAGLVTQVRQLERQAEKEAARVRHLQDLFQMALAEIQAQKAKGGQLAGVIKSFVDQNKTQGGQLEDQFQNLKEDTVAQPDQDSHPEMLQANMEELRDALQWAESRSRQVGQEKRQLEAELRDEKMSLLLTRAVNESLRPAGLTLLQKGDEFDGSAQNPESQSTSTENLEGMAGHDSEASMNSTENPDGMAGQSPEGSLRSLEASVQSPEIFVHSNTSSNSTKSPDGMAGHHSDATLNSTATICDTDFRLTAEDNIIESDAQVGISPLQRTTLFAITHEDLMRICSELDGSDERTNELEAAVADAMAVIRQYQSCEIQIEALSDEEHAKMVQEQMEQLQKALMHEVSHRRTLQEQYRVQEEKLTKMLQEVPSQSPVESQVRALIPAKMLQEVPPPPPPSIVDSAKPPAMKPSMTSLPSSLKEAQGVHALNKKLQKKDDMINVKQAQIKMLLAEIERMKTGSNRAKAEVARLRAKLRMCRCNCQHQSLAVTGMYVGDLDEVSDPSLKYQIQDEVHEVSADEEIDLDSSTRQVKSGVSSSGVIYKQMGGKQEPASHSFIPTRPHSSASMRRKPPVALSPVSKREEFQAGIVGTRVHSPTAQKQSTEAVPDKNLLPEIKPTFVKESMNAKRRPSANRKLSVPQATVRRHSDPEPTVSLSVLPVSSPGMIDLAKARPVSTTPPPHRGRVVVKPRQQEL